MQPVATEDLVDVSSMDDLLFFLMAARPMALVESMAKLITIVHRTCRAVQLKLNLQPGKTEAVFLFMGRGAKEAKLLVAQNGGVVVYDNAERLVLVVSHSYKHLGSMASPKDASRAEIVYRTQGAMAEYVKIRSRILGNVAVPRLVRMGFVDSLLGAKLTYSAPLWSWPVAKDLEKLDRLRVLAWRSVDRLHNKAGQDLPRITDAEVWSRCGRQTMAQHVQTLRLKYLSRLLRYGPPMLKALVQSTAASDRSWAARLRADMCDLVYAQPRGSKWHDFPPVDSGLAHYEAAASDPSSGWNASVQHLQWRHIAVTREAANAAIIARNTGEVPTPVLSPAPDSQLPVYTCAACNAEFASFKQLKAHCARKHDYLHHARYFVSGSACHCCCKEFHSSQRLFKHLLGVPKCLQAHVNFFRPLDREQVRGIMLRGQCETKANIRAGRSPTFASLPVMKFHGPGIL